MTAPRSTRIGRLVATAAFGLGLVVASATVASADTTAPPKTTSTATSTGNAHFTHLYDKASPVLL